MSNPNATNLPTIDSLILAAVTGGDGYGDYKSRLAQDWKDTKARYNAAVDNNLVNGHWNFGKWADNFAGTVYNGTKMAIDAVPELGPAITNRL